MNCDRTHDLSALHDGELPAAARAELHTHLQSCADCRAELAALRQLSASITAAALAEPSQITMARLVRAPQTQEYAVRRLAGWMTAAAAVLLAITLLQRPTATESPNPFMVIELASTVIDDEPPPETLTVARWMATDLALASARGGNP